MYGCDELNDIFPLHKLHKLQILNINGCYKIDNLDSLIDLNELHTLYKERCFHLYYSLSELRKHKYNRIPFQYSDIHICDISPFKRI